MAPPDFTVVGCDNLLVIGIQLFRERLSEKRARDKPER